MSTEIKSEIGADVKKGTGMRIILYNDEVNTFEHVIYCLIRYCGHDPVQAEQCASIVHANGKIDIKRGSLDEIVPINNALVYEKLLTEIEAG